jgi:hypothetical protein
MQLFAARMGWAWMGGIGFGGTSPIDGRPLEQAGMFSRQLRKVLPLVVADITAGREVSPEASRLADKSPFPLPRGVLIALINSRTRKAAKDRRLSLGCRLYAPE